MEQEQTLLELWKTAVIVELDDYLIDKCKCRKIPGMEQDDIAQEIRLHLWRKLDKYDPDRASIKTFCSRIIDNKLVDLFRVANRKALNHTIFIGVSDFNDEFISKKFKK
jgi:DNA-directed RNA polymerase specialized sigma24 family protein